MQKLNRISPPLFPLIVNVIILTFYEDAKKSFKRNLLKD
ncbi:hypothetical protein Bateq7PJ16_1275 [Bacillus subtilis]|nr:Hypothetical Protein U712_05895 [Bacillus subtilis PY79]AKN13237.1 hypothetical protein ABU16_2161 [Bacillus subtilis]EME07660.1 hypothetical protein BS732_1887 [Bacillus subtilis MB73/2]CCU57618.1 hypothetical protein BSUBE1_0987 [Bacillus subtilis E1]QHF57081.1 hypothetical protein Bateq7PJ16_1275 [Bacillus subtilis]